MLLLRKISFWLALLGILSTVLLVRRLQVEFDPPPPAPPLPPPTQPFARGIGAAGIVEALHENTAVGVPLPGLVSAVHVRVWDRVEAGAPLLQLDDRELRARLPVLESSVQVAQARIDALATRVLRAEKLSASGASPDSELVDLRAELTIARAEQQAAKAQVRENRLLLERLLVRAPVAGTILQVNVRPGESITTNASPAPLILGDLSRVQVRVDVDEHLAPRLRAGAAAIGYVKGDVGTPLALEFVRIEPFIVPKVSLTGASTERVDTRVLRVIYRLPAEHSAPIYVGQQLDVFIEEQNPAADL